MDILSLILKAGKLKEMKRKGWLRYGIDGESVASHIYRVAIISMIVGEKLGLNVEKLLKMALLHDICEADIGDITPHDMEKKEKIEIERREMKGLAESIGKREYYELWDEFVEGKSKEGRLLQEIDKFEMILQAYEYEKKYGKNLEEFKKEERNIKNPLLISLLEEIKKL